MRDVHTQATLPQQYQSWEEKEVRIQATLPVGTRCSKLTPCHQGVKVGVRLLHSQIG